MKVVLAFVGLVLFALGVALGSLASRTTVAAQAVCPPVPACPPIDPWGCGEAMANDYEDLIFDLVWSDLYECRERYGGCAPDSTWAHDHIWAERREERE